MTNLNPVRVVGIVGDTISVVSIERDSPAKPPTVEPAPLDIGTRGGPLYPPLMRALIAGEEPVRRPIAASSLRIAPKYRAPADMVAAVVRQFDSHRLINQEHLHEVLVMERSDGSLWSYDDCCYVEAAQQVDPLMTLPCAVYRDPTK